MMTAIFDLNVPFVSTKPTTNLFIPPHSCPEGGFHSKVKTNPGMSINPLLASGVGG